jgi:hypothetical protein
LKLKPGEIAVICDFCENYSIIKDEIPGSHWNNAEATLHPFVAYYSHKGNDKSHQFYCYQIV